MSEVIAGLPTRAPTIRERDAGGHPDRNRDPEPRPSWSWVLVEALANAGAAFNPAAALAARRLARIRDQELQDGHRRALLPSAGRWPST